ncbi:hypothetical protein HWV62_8951 [Athelia sp. TMB]|nr:hypothetical protein HWV62_8951 [Athelia sp. TMB]
MPPKNGSALSKKHSSDDLYYNAFATPSSSSSSVRASPTKPRRRRSTLRRAESDGPHGADWPHIHMTHSRSQTWADERDHNHEHAPHQAGHSRSQTWSNNHHPLGGPPPEDGWGVTRPQLSRVLGAWDPAGDGDGAGGGDGGRGAFAETSVRGGEEKTVLVHEVRARSPSQAGDCSRRCGQVAAGDSLAGVALRYGIRIAELRKANQLWTSDSIHLRKVLYIPIRDPAPDLDGGQPSTSSASSARGPPVSLDPAHDRPAVPTIRRIPASQLSFFPPASRSALYTRDDTLLPNTSPIALKRPGTAPVSAGGSPGPSALSSLLGALPMAASTRDTLIARLSFDSERASSASDEPDLELAEVRRAAKPLAPPSETARSVSPTTPRAPHAAWARTESAERLPAPVRTVQLEPSPVMRVPSAALKTKPRASGLDVDDFGAGW